MIRSGEQTTVTNFIGGGCYNLIRGGSNATNENFIGGCKGNLILDSLQSFVGGGNDNQITEGNRNSSIVGGKSNRIQSYTYCDFNFIGGGRFNNICGSAWKSAILGGECNTIANYRDSFVIGSYLTASANNYSFMNNLCVSGLVKSSGTFKISHPDPSKNKTHTLSHSFVESPTAGDNIYRYEVEVKDGVATIDLPEYFKYLNENTQVWVSAKNGFGIGYGEINDDFTQITIYANLDMRYNVLIVGTRKDEIAVKHWKGVERVKSKGELEADKNKLKSEENKLNEDK
jgi:hypothetical protein